MARRVSPAATIRCTRQRVDTRHEQVYNVRYRICELHLRAASVDVDGSAARWCQTCVRDLLA